MTTHSTSFGPKDSRSTLKAPNSFAFRYVVCSVQFDFEGVTTVLVRDRTCLAAVNRSSSRRLGLRFRFRLDHKEQNDADHREHSEGGILAVPHFRLPHQEPLPADAEKNDKPHQ